MRTLWTRLRAEPERAVAWGLMAIGALLLVLTWLGVRSDPYIVSQLARVTSGGLGGLWMLGVGAGLMVFADLCDEWRKLDRIEQALRGEPAAPHPAGSNQRFPNAAKPPLMLIGGFAAAGAVVIAVAWNRAATVSDPRQGFRAIGLAIAGLIVTSVGVAAGSFWLVRTCRLRTSHLLAPWLVESLRTQVGVHVAPAPLRPPPTTLEPQVVVVGGGLTHFHTPGCPVLETGGPYHEVPAQAPPPGLEPCGICMPDDEPEHAAWHSDGLTLRAEVARA